jgi:hypothetical protein
MNTDFGSSPVVPSPPVFLTPERPKKSKKKFFAIGGIALLIALALLSFFLLNDNADQSNEIQVVKPDYAWDCNLLDEDGQIRDNVRLAFVDDGIVVQKGAVRVDAKYDLASNDNKYGFISEYGDRDKMEELFGFVPRILIISRNNDDIELRWENVAVYNNSPHKQSNAYCKQTTYDFPEGL